MTKQSSTYTLGISAYYHDSAVCLLKDDQLVFAAQEERFSRLKHDASFPSLAIQSMFKTIGITNKDLNYVSFYDKPLLKFDRILTNYLHVCPAALRSWNEAIPQWLKDKLWIKTKIRSELKYEGDILFPEHHLSHAASAYFPSPFQSSAILTIDGVGEWASTTLGHGKENHATLNHEITYPHSLGLLYSAFTYYLGFKVNEGEYKVMGLAPYGHPTFTKKILDHLICLKPDGSFHLNLKYFSFHHKLHMTDHSFDALFGQPRRQPESKLLQFHMDIAASLQKVTEAVVLALAHQAKEITGEKNLCMAGGVALNCVANGLLLKKKIFDNLWIQPAAGDAGGALGAAYLARYHHGGSQRTVAKPDAMHGTYLGPAFSQRDIAIAIDQHILPTKKSAITKLSTAKLCQITASHIANGHVVGWFQGKMEYGPRSLGNRSILGDARSPKMQRLINQKIKFRESFRPFAPSVLEEHVTEYFDLPVTSPYMLLVAQVAKAQLRKPALKDAKKKGLALLHLHRSTIPAVTHVDYSARIQTVSKQTNPRYHQLLNAFYVQTSCPVIINTSFNVRGEPIVCTPQDAIKCFYKTDIDYLVLGNYLISKQHTSYIQPKENQVPISLRRRVISGITTLTTPIGVFNTKLVVSLIYLLALTPLAYILKATGKRFLDTSLESNTNSFWQTVETKSLTKQY